MKNLDNLFQRVETTDTVRHSIVTLITGLKQELDTAIEYEDYDTLRQISEYIGSNSQAFAEAVCKNTELEEEEDNF
jgi:hypothetical protein